MPPLPPEVSRRDFRGEKAIVPEIQHVGWSRFPRAVQHGLGPHAHRDSYEICYIVRGNLDWWVEERVYEVQAGQIFLTHPNERHGGVGMVMNPCELFWIQVAIPEHHALPGLDGQQTQLLRRDFKALRARYFAARHGEMIKTYFQNMLDELTQPGAYAPTILRSALHGLLVQVLADYKLHAQQIKTQKTASSPAVRRVMDIVETSDHERWTVTQLAQEVGLGASQLRTNFARDMGCSPLEYLQRRRIARAKQTLHFGKSITQIAVELGFSSSQHFATTFKKWVGMTPGEYRKMAGDSRAGLR